MYDYVKVKCAFCKRKTYSQTKILNGCNMMTFEVGDEVYTDDFKTDNLVVGLKEKCEHCNNQINIIIKNKKIVGTTKKSPDFIERNFGGVEEVDKLKRMVEKKVEDVRRR